MSDDLNKRIAEAQKALAPKGPPSQAASGPGMSLGFRMAADFVAAIIVGALLGWGIDALAHSSPWGLVVCLLLGFITGVWNAVRAASQANSQAGSSGAADETKGKDDRP
jgi:ATP synthase protein I